MVKRQPKKLPTPSKTLVRYLADLSTNQKIYLAKESAAGALTKAEKIERKRLQKNKYYTLKKHVFTSIENLIFFLEQSKRPEFDGMFDKYIVQLFTGTNISRLLYAPLDAKLFKDQDDGYSEQFNKQLAQIAATAVIEGSRICIEYYKRAHGNEPEDMQNQIINPIKLGSALCKAISPWERVTNKLVLAKFSNMPPKLKKLD